MLGNFGLKLQNSPRLPHIHARFYCNANEQRAIGPVTTGKRMTTIASCCSGMEPALLWEKKIRLVTALDNEPDEGVTIWETGTFPKITHQEFFF